ncbi:HIT family protein [Shouchella lonarensis]|uniref:Histidine triad (HIT) family protein n=1 Tax=Shouchella lonarensis TaxID=1464122 RepID=A0A1G6JUI7_9BACI|nr:HIT family protein [Shouchella lonarensis]SDC22410.1 histidine triad (HIT) family protein [Shouchella lonarensis]
MHTDCIFCKIVEGNVPATKIYEDDDTLAFFDISQVTKGHTLVIPKAHHENIYTLPADSAAKLFSVVPKIATALKETFQVQGMNVLNNNGEKAGQSVFHYHLHLLPRYEESGLYGPLWHTQTTTPDFDALKTYATAIRAHITDKP